MSAITLPPKYVERKAKLRRKIDEGMQTWHEVAGLLIDIKESGEWFTEYKTWELFCADFCKFTKRQADSLIHDEKAYLALKEAFLEMGSDFPSLTQSGVQKVGKLPTKEKKQKALKVLSDSGTTRPTNKQVEAAIESVTDADFTAVEPNPSTGEVEPEPQPTCCPTCKRPY